MAFIVSEFKFPTDLAILLCTGWQVVSDSYSSIPLVNHVSILFGAVSKDLKKSKPSRPNKYNPHTNSYEHEFGGQLT